MKMVRTIIALSVMLPGTVFAWGWNDLWHTPDQQGIQLLKQNKASAAAQTFKDKNWQAVSNYRSGNYEQALQHFNSNKTSDGQYNAGNAAAYLGRYQDAIKAYDKAIALNANNQDAIINREIVKKLLQQQQQNQQQQDKKNNQDKQNQQSNNQKQNSDNKSSDKKEDKSNQDSKQNNQQQPQQSKQNKQDQQSPQNQPSQANSQQLPSDKQPQQPNTAASNSQRRQEEKNNQLLRRLSDEPGGLLQRKFERDYLHRHGIQENNNQGVYQ